MAVAVATGTGSGCFLHRSQVNSLVLAEYGVSQLAAVHAGAGHGVVVVVVFVARVGRGGFIEGFEVDDEIGKGHEKDVSGLQAKVGNADGFEREYRGDGRGKEDNNAVCDVEQYGKDAHGNHPRTAGFLAHHDGVVNDGAEYQNGENENDNKDGGAGGGAHVEQDTKQDVPHDVRHNGPSKEGPCTNTAGQFRWAGRRSAEEVHGFEEVYEHQEHVGDTSGNPEGVASVDGRCVRIVEHEDAISGGDECCKEEETGEQV